MFSSLQNSEKNIFTTLMSIRNVCCTKSAY